MQVKLLTEKSKRDWITSVLVNDENASDEEMLQYFMENGLSQAEAEKVMAQRNAALKDPLHFELKESKLAKKDKWLAKIKNRPAEIQKLEKELAALEQQKIDMGWDDSEENYELAAEMVGYAEVANRIKREIRMLKNFKESKVNEAAKPWQKDGRELFDVKFKAYAHIAESDAEGNPRVYEILKADREYVIYRSEGKWNWEQKNSAVNFNNNVFDTPDEAINNLFQEG